MIAHIDREESYDFVLYEVSQDSSTYERKRSVEVPDELVERYKKVQHEYREVQKLLRELYEREIDGVQGW